MYTHILIPTDGSGLSEKAVRSGIQLAKALGARVTGLYVIAGSLVAKGLGKTMVPETEEQIVARAETYLAVVRDLAQAAGVPCECAYVHGYAPHEEIVKAAESRGCDLICMASHGRRGIASLLLGSETQHVLTHGKVPVLVCR